MKENVSEEEIPLNVLFSFQLHFFLPFHLSFLLNGDNYHEKRINIC